MCGSIPGPLFCPANLWVSASTCVTRSPLVQLYEAWNRTDHNDPFYLFFSHSFSSPCSFVLFIYFRKSFSLYRISAELQRLLPASCRLGGMEALTRLWLPRAHILNSKQEAESTHWEWHDLPSLPSFNSFSLAFIFMVGFCTNVLYTSFDLYQVFYTHAIWFTSGVSLTDYQQYLAFYCFPCVLSVY